MIQKAILNRITVHFDGIQIWGYQVSSWYFSNTLQSVTVIKCKKSGSISFHCNLFMVCVGERWLHGHTHTHVAIPKFSKGRSKMATGIELQTS
jgi:hypothetical protein